MELRRAIAIIDTKSVNDARRVFSGVASTPEPDRMSDTIDPLGASFRNPLVLLHQHDHDRPIGTVHLKKPTARGIEFTAEIPTVIEPGPLRDRVDVAWGEIVAGLVRAVSIGFRPIGTPTLNRAGGLDFHEIEILELSTVSVPANAGAVITEIRAIDQRARSKARRDHVARLSPGDLAAAKSGRVTLTNEDYARADRIASTRIVRVKPPLEKLDPARLKIADRSLPKPQQAPTVRLDGTKAPRQDRIVRLSAKPVRTVKIWRPAPRRG